MELESLFTASKWEILQHLAQQPLSPLQLAERSSTSLANISQQLRLLEMAGLVKSERVSNRDKGQPRILYRIAGDQGYLIAATNEFTDKRLLKLDARNKAVMRIWFYDDENVRYLLEKAFWRVEHLLPRMTSLGVLKVGEASIELGMSGEGLTTEDAQPLVLEDLEGKRVTLTFRIGKETGHVLYGT